MKVYFLALAFLFISTAQGEIEDLTKRNQSFVLETKQILFEDFPQAFNPSLIEFKDHYLLTFRFSPDVEYQPWVSHIVVVLLDQDFSPISKPQIIETREEGSLTPSQAEDARVFSYRGRNFLIYNDNTEVVFPTYRDRRDLYLAELFFKEGTFCLSAPQKLFCSQKLAQVWQKNWVPFEWNQSMFFGYMVVPHEILYPNLCTGECYSCYSTEIDFVWEEGMIKGGTPALLVDGEYLAFFHSSKYRSSPISEGVDAWHYFMGAYTFSSKPPFSINKISPYPIIEEGFYEEGFSYKKVIFPGGFVVKEDKIFLAYGKDDSQIWIATLDLKGLKNSLILVDQK